MRGEDSVSNVDEPIVAGSPPHARGRPGLRMSGAPEYGITPACAGKTRRAARRGERTSDHPRMRGEDSYASNGISHVEGSPPHARGRHSASTDSSYTHRITPACAGKTRFGSVSCRPSRDHPRMRGEDVLDAEQNIRLSGITPACAGKTSSLKADLNGSQDHPRMRGEDTCDNVDQVMVHGSPPHARGRRLEFFPDSLDARITPACAGKTRALRSSTPRRRDHPRMRGEDQKAVEQRVDAKGSPPHARGRLSVKKGDLVMNRITPACAGKTET